ncbi:MAG: L,D-transpeptidase family protein [Actinomycetota bacterium]|nr:L,D-transpeptidase family protein [Actinomycetota bacterium]
MNPRIRVVAPVLLAAALVAGDVPSARGQEAPGVTLSAGRRAIDFGESVLLRGEIDPPSEGETISIGDESGRERATATTDAEGRYRVRVAPRRTTQFQARWVAIPSEPVKIKVRPRVTIALRAVRLFGQARIAGRVAPVQDAGRVTVVLHRGGRRLWQRKVTLRDGRRFGTTFEIGKVGRFSASASFTDAAGARGGDRSAAKSTPLPSLGPGSRGVYVRLLESRLCALAYHLRDCDRRYGEDTADALRAFNKVAGRARLGTVDAATWHALAGARTPKPRLHTDGFHIEVDQTRQVLFMVKDSRVTGILHVSTGAGQATRDGTFRVYRKIGGYSPGRLYYPSYFDGLRALHGWPEVPTYNASHGCVRLPMWSATWVYGKADIGTTVHIYH